MSDIYRNALASFELTRKLIKTVLALYKERQQREVQDLEISWLCLRVSKTREGNGTPLQYPCMENPMNGGAWEAAFQMVTKSRT